MEMGKLSQNNIKLRDLQLKSLEILVYFKEFCMEHGLTFFLCGGACIGAVRHKGFIPWDDDIDVFMPRDDYNRLGELWNKYADTDRYSYCITNKEINLRHCVATIRDNNTCFIRDYQADLDINHGIRLEILPLDGCPESKIQRLIQIGWAFIFHLFNREATSVGFSKFVGKISSFILKIIRKRESRYKIWKYAEKRMTKYPINESTKYITELCSPYRYMKIRYPAKIFKEQSWLMFEGHMMPVPIGYDEYLRMAFGNYMELPPIEERVPKHNTVYIDLNNSYKEYKGIYYCVEK
ncbi:MAG: LicD family protein [Peptococcales bacterium]